MQNIEKFVMLISLNQTGNSALNWGLQSMWMYELVTWQIKIIWPIYNYADNDGYKIINAHINTILLVNN